MKNKKVLLVFPCFLLIFLFLVGIYFSIPLFIMVISIENKTIEGIENYYPAISSVGLCQYLTVRDEFNGVSRETVLFIDKYVWQHASFVYKYDYQFKSRYESVSMVLSYENEEYVNALGDVVNQPGFSDEIQFEYGGYQFFLNDTERKK